MLSLSVGYVPDVDRHGAVETQPSDLINSMSLTLDLSPALQRVLGDAAPHDYFRTRLASPCSLVLNTDRVPSGPHYTIFEVITGHAPVVMIPDTSIQDQCTARNANGIPFRRKGC